MEAKSDRSFQCSCATSFNVTQSQLGEIATCPKCRASCMPTLDNTTSTDPSAVSSTSSPPTAYEQTFQNKQIARRQNRARSKAKRNSSKRNSHQPNPPRKTFWPYVLYAGAAIQFIFPVVCWAESFGNKYDQGVEQFAISVTMRAITSALFLATLGFLTKCLTDIRWMQAEEQKETESAVK